MHSSLEEKLKVLFGSNAAFSILKWLCANKDGHLRLIAEECKLYPVEAKNQLEKFSDAGILLKDKDGNKIVYSLNSHCACASLIRKIFDRKRD